MKNRILLFSLLISTTLFSQNWNTDYSKALELAENENKNIVLVFSGSDWCGPCIKLDKKIWNSDEFINYSDEYWILLKADFPKKKKNKLTEEQQNHNDNLAEKYNKSGHFPLIVILNSEGEVLGETEYKKYSPEKYVKHLSSFE